MTVANDGVEQGVKLESDFVETARSEEHFHNVLQVVEKDRRHTKQAMSRKKITKHEETTAFLQM